MTRHRRRQWNSLHSFSVCHLPPYFVCCALVGSIARCQGGRPGWCINKPGWTSRVWKTADSPPPVCVLYLAGSTARHQSGRPRLLTNKPAWTKQQSDWLRRMQTTLRDTQSTGPSTARSAWVWASRAGCMCVCGGGFTYTHWRAHCSRAQAGGCAEVRLGLGGGGAVRLAEAHVDNIDV